jgi:subtilase family serine protease
VALGWSPARRISTSISYEFVVRSGTGSTGTINGVGVGASYKQNRIDLTVSYSF